MDHTTMSMPMAMAPVSGAAAATTMGSHSEAAAAAAAAAMGSSSSAMMAMTFFQARGTPLFATGWAPRSGAAYAATCLFLVALGVVLRCLLALRPLLEDLVWRAPPPPPPPHDPAAAEDGDDYDEYDEDDEAEEQKHPVDCEILVPSPGGKPESRRPGAHARHRLHRAAGRHPPSAARALWTEIRRRGRASRVGVSAGRAAFELLLAVVGYLLMLAVMTMNLGYFASVLAGVFLGTFVLGDLATSSSLYQDHHC